MHKDSFKDVIAKQEHASHPLQRFQVLPHVCNFPFELRAVGLWVILEGRCSQTLVVGGKVMGACTAFFVKFQHAIRKVNVFALTLQETSVIGQHSPLVGHTFIQPFYFTGRLGKLRSVSGTEKRDYEDCNLVTNVVFSAGVIQSVRRVVFVEILIGCRV